MQHSADYLHCSMQHHPPHLHTRLGCCSLLWFALLHSLLDLFRLRLVCCSICCRCCSVLVVTSVPPPGHLVTGASAPELSSPRPRVPPGAARHAAVCSTAVSAAAPSYCSVPCCCRCAHCQGLVVTEEHWLVCTQASPRYGHGSIMGTRPELRARARAVTQGRHWSLG